MNTGRGRHFASLSPWLSTTLDQTFVFKKFRHSVSTLYIENQEEMNCQSLEIKVNFNSRLQIFYA